MEEVMSGDLVVDEESTMSVTTNSISEEEMSIHSSPMYFLPTTKFFLFAIIDSEIYCCYIFI
jgi:hypothetical protein